MGKAGEKIVNALKATNQFLADHRDNFDKIVEGTRIVYDAAVEIAKKRKVAVNAVFTGDPVADKALLQAEGVSQTLGSKGIDMELVLSLLYKILELGAGFVTFAKK